MLIKQKSDTLNQKIADKIKQRRLQIAVHSYIYYKLDRNIITDITYDKWSKELAQLQKQYPVVSKSVKDYYKEFKSWDGGSGFKLNPDDWIKYKAQYLLDIQKEIK